MNNFSTHLSSQSIWLLSFLIQEQRICKVVSTSHWITPVIMVDEGWIKEKRVHLNSPKIYRSRQVQYSTWAVARETPNSEHRLVSNPELHSRRHSLVSDKLYIALHNKWMQQYPEYLLWNRRKTLTGSPNGTNRPCTFRHVLTQSLNSFQMFSTAWTL